ncbi:metallophosphoesterase [Methanocaldococcus infernus ME]|uniref:Metallophosphoesterase n=1 Tax=Methanocaldococcus infernus (strain DSM 11812 / JCM 15783 / ME) TaxID=573063 RepID=D5VS82_METIM|nr:metallophosphoesterase [Methanocaldococcus infernus]ADG13435.1 metallophosphoesterase [Methanocaldococcus infernus ME]
MHIKYLIYIIFSIILLSPAFAEENSIFFVHMADIHLCNDSEVNKIFGGSIPPVTTMKSMVKEILAFHPDTVVQTGDIVALADRYDLDTDQRWYELVNKTVVAPIKNAGIPFIFAPGNHDPAAYKLNVNKSDWRYYNGLLLKYVDWGLGANNTDHHTYYSYTIGNYHFVVIDPYETPESGYRAVMLPKDQVNWLKSDLENNSNKFIIICYHQPLGSWYNDSINEFLGIISKYKGHIILLAGHTHDVRTLYWNGIPEYQDGAACGDWWQTGKTPDGKPMGYAIYYIKKLDNGSYCIYRFYKGFNLSEQINLVSPEDVVLNESKPLILDIYTGNKQIASVTYKTDNGKESSLNFTLINATKVYWYHVKGIIKPSTFDNKNHNITIIVHCKDGTSFNKTIVYKFSKHVIMPIKEIIDDTNFKNYYGRFVVINGTIINVAYSGNLLQISDDTGEIVVWAGDCHHKEFKIGDEVILRGQITQFKGTKELKLVRDEDAIIYGYKNITSKVIKVPNIQTLYDNFTQLENKYVEVSGVATAVFGDEVVIQDTTRGIQLWLGEIKHPEVKIGDKIVVRGLLSKYKNMPEIVVGLDKDFIINGTGKVPEPKVITINEIPENIGNLVTIKNLKVISVDDYKIIVSDGKNTTVIYCKKANINPKTIVKVGDKIDVIGIAYIYESIYEICPRFTSDITVLENNEGIVYLKRGWNAISIPHNGNVSYEDPNAVITIITYYNNTWHQVTKLKTLYGYFIYCNKSTIMHIIFVNISNPIAPPKRPITKGWNLVGVNPAKNDVDGVLLKSFVIPIEDIWAYLIDMDGNCYDKYNCDDVKLKPYEAYWLYSKGYGELCGRSLN